MDFAAIDIPGRDCLCFQPTVWNPSWLVNVMCIVWNEIIGNLLGTCGRCYLPLPKQTVKVKGLERIDPICDLAKDLFSFVLLLSLLSLQVRGKHYLKDF